MKPVSENGEKKLKFQYIVDIKRPDAMAEPLKSIERSHPCDVQVRLYGFGTDASQGYYRMV